LYPFYPKLTGNTILVTLDIRTKTPFRSVRPCQAAELILCGDFAVSSPTTAQSIAPRGRFQRLRWFCGQSSSRFWLRRRPAQPASRHSVLLWTRPGERLQHDQHPALSHVATTLLYSLSSIPAQEFMDEMSTTILFSPSFNTSPFISGSHPPRTVCQALLQAVPPRGSQVRLEPLGMVTSHLRGRTAHAAAGCARSSARSETSTCFSQYISRCVQSEPCSGLTDSSALREHAGCAF